MTRTHFEIHFFVEKNRFFSEKAMVRGNVVGTTLTSSKDFAGQNMLFANENGVLK